MWVFALFFALVAIRLAYITFFLPRIEMHNKRRRALFILSLVAFALILFPLANVRVSYIAEKTLPPRVYVYVDDSISMRQRYEQGVFSNEIAQFLARATGSTPEHVTFGSFIRKSEGVFFHDARTRYEHLFTRIITRKKNTKHIIVSDGNAIIPMENAYALPPLITVRPNVPATNIALARGIAKGETARGEAVVNTPLTLEYTLYAEGLAGDDRVRVTFAVDEKEVHTTNIRIENGKTLFSIPYTPKTQGVKVLSTRVTPVTGERTDFDNELHRVIEVTKEKKNVLFLAGSPAKDVGTLRAFLEKEKTLSLTSHVFMPGKETAVTLPEGDDIDLLIVMNPTEEVGNALSPFIDAYMRKGGPILVFYATYAEDVPRYRAIFPAVRKTFASIALSIEESDSPFIRFLSDSEKNKAIWRRFSFFTTHFVPTEYVGGVLLRANGEPALVYRKVEQSDVLSVFFAPLSLLKMYGSRLGLDRYYDVFLARAIDTLLEAKDEVLPLSTDRDNYTLGDHVRVTVRHEAGAGSAYLVASYESNASPRSIPRAKESDTHITVSRERPKALLLSHEGRRSYTFLAKDPGLLRVSLHDGNGVAFAKHVVALTPAYEEVVPPGDGGEALAALATLTEGAYYDRLSGAIWQEERFEKEVIRHTASQSLWRNPFYFFTLLLILLVLWALKRLSGLS